CVGGRFTATSTSPAPAAPVSPSARFIIGCSRWGLDWLGHERSGRRRWLSGLGRLGLAMGWCWQFKSEDFPGGAPNRAVAGFRPHFGANVRRAFDRLGRRFGFMNWGEFDRR